MRKALPVVAIIALLVAASASAQMPRRAARSGSDPTPPKPQFLTKIWIAESYSTWQDAAGAFVALSGDGMMMKTGDDATPYVVLRQVVSGSYMQVPPPVYRCDALRSMNDLFSHSVGLSWWRVVSTDDGGMIVVSKND